MLKTLNENLPAFLRWKQKQVESGAPRAGVAGLAALRHRAQPQNGNSQTSSLKASPDVTTEAWDFLPLRSPPAENRRGISAMASAGKGPCPVTFTAYRYFGSQRA